MSGQGSHPDFNSMSLDELAKWYAQAVGYNPVEDDPSLTVEELRRTCFDYVALAELDGAGAEGEEGA